MRIELRDALEFLFPDSPAQRTPADRLALDVARGGTISANLLIHDAPRGSLRLGASESGRPVRSARWSRLHDVPVEENTAPVIFTESRKSGRNRHVIRRAPFRVFDAMEPLVGTVRTAGGTVALRVDLSVARDARPGVHAILLRVGTAAPLRIAARVHPAAIPPSGSASFPYTNWFDTVAMASRHGVAAWSESHWRMIARYAELMRQARQNMFWIPLHLVFSRKRGVPVLDAARLRRLVDLFTRAGLHWIEGGHVATRAKGWERNGFTTAVGGPRGVSAAGDRDLRALLSPLRAEIDRNGWRRRWIQHVADEPNPAMAADYRILCGITRKYLPGIPLLDAIEDPSLTGSVDIWCPKANAWQEHRAAYDAIRSSGDRMWFYTCCEPGGKWLNRLLDMELLRPALFGWAAARFDLDGFLHWGLNHYQRTQDPFRRSIVPMGAGPHTLPAGDTHIVYPGPDGPWSSVRLEAQREGFEDLELLRALRRRNPARAARIIRPALRSFSDYTTDVRVFRSARRALLAASSS